MYQDHSAPIPGAEDPAETLGYRDGRRVVRGEASSKVLRPLDVPEESVLRGGDRILAGDTVYPDGSIRTSSGEHLSADAVLKVVLDAMGGGRR